MQSHRRCGVCGWAHSDYLTCASAETERRELERGSDDYAETEPVNRQAYVARCPRCKYVHPLSYTCMQAADVRTNRRADRMRDRILQRSWGDAVAEVRRRVEISERLERRLSESE